jgi:hypothetical protein
MRREQEKSLTSYEWKTSSAAIASSSFAADGDASCSNAVYQIVVFRIMRACSRHGEK